MQKLPFGLVIFPLGSNTLPNMMDNGDLDSDLYFTLWDRDLVVSAVGGHNDVCLRVKVLKDALINSAFQ